VLRISLEFPCAMHKRSTCMPKVHR